MKNTILTSVTQLVTFIDSSFDTLGNSPGSLRLGTTGLKNNVT